MKLAAIYTRVSTTQQEQEGSSLDTQEAACRELAAREGYSVEHVFREVYSGANLYDRPELNKLRDLIRNKRIDVFIIYDLDRLTRKQSHRGVIVSELDKYDVVLHSVLDGTSEKGALGEFLQDVKVFVAEFEREKILERTMRLKLNRVHVAGKPLGQGRTPYGYVWEGDRKERLIPHPKTAAVVQRIYRSVADGDSANSLAIGLNGDGVLTPTARAGSRWTAATVCLLIRRPLYKGEYAALRWEGYKETQDSTERVAGDTLPKIGVVLPDVATPLVSEELWEAAQAGLDRNRTGSRRNNPNPENALLRAGFVFCGHCRKHAVVQQRGYSSPELIAKYKWKDVGPHYTCQQQNRNKFGCPYHSILARKLDPLVWSAIRKKLEDPERLRLELKKLQGEDPTVHDRVMVGDRLAAVTVEEKQLADSLGKITNDVVRNSLIIRINELGAARLGLERERDELDRRRTAYLQMNDHVDNLVAWSQRMRERLSEPELSYELKRRALHLLGVRVFMYQKDMPCNRIEIEMGLPIEGHEIERIALLTS